MLPQIPLLTSGIHKYAFFSSTQDDEASSSHPEMAPSPGDDDDEDDDGSEEGAVLSSVMAGSFEITPNIQIYVGCPFSTFVT